MIISSLVPQLISYHHFVVVVVDVLANVSNEKETSVRCHAPGVKTQEIALFQNIRLIVSDLEHHRKALTFKRQSMLFLYGS